MCACCCDVSECPSWTFGWIQLVGGISVCVVYVCMINPQCVSVAKIEDDDGQLIGQI